MQGGCILFIFKPLIKNPLLRKERIVLTTIKDYYTSFYQSSEGEREVWHIPSNPSQENHFRGFCQQESSFLNSYRMQWKGRHEFSLFTTAYLFHGLHDFNKENRNYKSIKRRELKSSHYRKPFNYGDNIILDRLYFDFDMTPNQILIAENVPCDTDDLDLINEKMKQVKAEERKTLHDATFDEKLDFYYRKFNESIYFRQPLEDAKKVARMFESQFNIKGHHVFTGSKGVHSYYLFKPVRIRHATSVIRFIADKIFNQLKITTGDSHVLHDTTKSRVPFSYNPKTNMTVTPFNLDDDYFTIIDRSHELSRSHGFNPLEDLPFKIDPPVLQESDKLHDLLLQGESYFDKVCKENEESRRRFNLLNQRKYNIEYKNQITIEKPSDVDKLLQFPCFQQFQFESRTNKLTFVGFLSFTHLKSVEDVQEANIRFWRQKGVNLKRSRQGLYQTQTVYRKYYLTDNSMRNHDYCRGCDFKDCFRNKIKMHPSYYAKIEEHKQEH